MTRVVIESPLAGRPAAWIPKWLPFLVRWSERRSRERHKAYARACMRDSLGRGEAPYASHLLFDQPGLLNDADAKEREQGIVAGFAWGVAGSTRAFYMYLGMSGGMERGALEAERLGQHIVYRKLDK